MSDALDERLKALEAKLPAMRQRLEALEAALGRLNEERTQQRMVAELKKGPFA